MEGETYRPTLAATETYLSGAVTVTRHLYRPAGRGSKSICPLELRAGIVAGYFTPRAARQAAFVTAQLTPGESAALFVELEGMRPSRASLDRLPKTLSAHWEQRRQDFESALRAQETVSVEATVMAISVDGVIAPMKAGTAKRSAKQAEPGKHARGPTGNREIGGGTVVLYNADGARAQTLRYGRMPENKKASLQQQLLAEVASRLLLFLLDSCYTPERNLDADFSRRTSGRCGLEVATTRRVLRDRFGLWRSTPSQIRFRRESKPVLSVVEGER